MAPKQRKQTGSGRTLSLPGVEATFYPPDHYVPTREDLDEVMRAARPYVPSREMAAWFGGLGLLAAFSVVDWPVAAAIGAGAVIAQRGGNRT